MRNKDYASVSVVRTIVGPKIRRGNENALYNRWKHIRERCTNPKRKDYKWYGAKGVTMCEEWNSYVAFHSWFFDALLKYARDNDTSVFSGNLVIDRIDPSKGYSPDNCRLITVCENARLAIKGRDKKGRFCIAKDEVNNG